MKRTSLRSGACVTLPIQPAERIHPALEHLPADAPRALARAIASSDAASDAASDCDRLVVRLSEFNEALRAGTFITWPATWLADPHGAVEESAALWSVERWPGECDRAGWTRAGHEQEMSGT